MHCTKKRKLSKYTLKAYKLDLQQFIDCLGGHHSIQTIERNHISRFHAQLADLELAPTSIKRKLACVKSMFSWLEHEELVVLNPFHRFKADIKLPKRLPKNVQQTDLRKMLVNARSQIEDTIPALTESAQPAQSTDPITSIDIAKSTGSKKGTQSKKAKESAKSSKQSSPTKPKNTTIWPPINNKRDLNTLTGLVALELMLCTGIRVGELVQIELQNVFINERKIKIFGKGSRERYVFLSDKELSQLLNHYIKQRLITEPTSDHLLVNSRGKSASTQFIRKLIKNIANSAHTQTHVTPHMLRHSAACELLNSGLDIRFVQRLLGHSSISTTEIYTHVTDNTLQLKIEEANIRGRLVRK